jgi:hypothetical protein
MSVTPAANGIVNEAATFSVGALGASARDDGGKAALCWLVGIGEATGPTGSCCALRAAAAEGTVVVGGVGVAAGGGVGVAAGFGASAIRGAAAGATAVGAGVAAWRAGAAGVAARGAAAGGVGVGAAAA